MRHGSARGCQDHSDRAWVRCRLVVPLLDSGGAQLVPDVPDRGNSGRSGPGTRMLVAMRPEIAAPHSARPPQPDGTALADSIVAAALGRVQQPCGTWLASTFGRARRRSPRSAAASAASAATAAGEAAAGAA